jgi:hypothetical protein
MRAEGLDVTDATKRLGSLLMRLQALRQHHDFVRGAFKDGYD